MHTGICAKCSRKLVKTRHDDFSLLCIQTKPFRVISGIRDNDPPNLTRLHVIVSCFVKFPWARIEPLSRADRVEHAIHFPGNTAILYVDEFVGLIMLVQLQEVSFGIFLVTESLKFWQM
ncbi:hypothetical protein D3C85_1462350 [compost metagenome]